MTLPEQADSFANEVDAIAAMLDDGDTLGALRAANVAADSFTELMANIAQAAYNGGASKRAIADALGVSVHTFRGMRRQVPA